MSRRCARLLAATLALALAACTQVRNPATGELQYTSLTPQQEKAAGPRGAPQGAGAVRRAISAIAMPAGLCRAGRQPGQERVRAEGPAVHLHPARQRRGQRLRPARRLCLRDARPAGADQQRGRARRRAGARGRPRDRAAHRPALRPGPGRADRRDRGAARRVPCWAACWAAPKGRSSAAQLAGQVGSLGAEAYVQGYSREQEFQADQLGIRYLAAAGYDPDAMATFLATLQADDAYRAAPGRAGRRRGRFSGRLVPQPPAHARSGRAGGGRGERGVPGCARDRPAGPAGRDRRHALRRGSGAGRGQRPQLPAPGAAHRLRGAAGLQAAELAGRRWWARTGRGRLMVFDMAPKDVAGDLRGYLQSGWVTQPAAAGPAERRPRRPRGRRRVRPGQRSAASRRRPCSRVVRGQDGTRLPLPVRATPRPRPRPTSPPSSRPCAASGRSRRPRRRR